MVVVRGGVRGTGWRAGREMAAPWVGRVPGLATVPASLAGCGWAWTSAIQPPPPLAGLGRHPPRPPSGSQPEPEVAGLHSQRHWGWSWGRGSLRGRTGTGRFGALALEIQRGWCHQSGCHYYHHHRHRHHNQHPSSTAGQRHHHQWRSTCTAGRLGCTATVRAGASRRSRAGQGRPHWQAPRAPLETQDMRLLCGLGQGRWQGRRHHRQAPAPATQPRQPRSHTCCSSLGGGRGPWRGAGEAHWGQTQGLPLAQRLPRGRHVAPLVPNGSHLGGVRGWRPRC